MTVIAPITVTGCPDVAANGDDDLAAEFTALVMCRTVHTGPRPAARHATWWHRQGTAVALVAAIAVWLCAAVTITLTADGAVSGAAAWSGVVILAAYTAVLVLLEAVTRITHRRSGGHRARRR